MFPEQPGTHRATAFRFFLIVLFSAALCVVPSAAFAAKPPANNNGQLSIAATPKQVTAGRAVAITGKLKGTSNAGQGIVIQTNPFPFAGYVSGGTTSTDATGNYRFSATPTLNTRYRVQTTTVTPAQTSGEITVPVSPRISLSLSDRTPKSGQLVRFYGHVWPSHDGRTAQIQRRTTTGSWQSVARVTLKDDGDLRSTYSRRVRIRKNGTFRVQLLADADHATGYSTTRFVRVH
jgi:hypothetical protein